jgi:hypothetical protein
MLLEVGGALEGWVLGLGRDRVRVAILGRGEVRVWVGRRLIERRRRGVDCWRGSWLLLLRRIRLVGMAAMGGGRGSTTLGKVGIGPQVGLGVIRGKEVGGCMRALGVMDGKLGLRSLVRVFRMGRATGGREGLLEG